MDNKLKLQIDKKINQYEKIQKYERIKELYPYIQLDDKCPYGSKKKFKNCWCERCPTYNLISHIINLPHLGSIS